MSIDSVILGLLLAKQNPTHDRENTFIYTRAHPTLGFETLPVLYDPPPPPHSLSIWSMMSFLAAFSSVCFENSDLLTPSLTLYCLNPHIRLLGAGGLSVDLTALVGTTRILAQRVQNSSFSFPLKFPISTFSPCTYSSFAIPSGSLAPLTRSLCWLFS
ncbi:hypothetical protein B0H16DRAFT_1542523 [Mycena metata]|uniref:Uncharacterized protein n=1 Tax=Mycena metata TaxID=1033252 RepID=A0AAD7NC21_9AGAR|nr:hypothetical protein B0H16DRAFT_1542523 [Mycena metata]